SSLCTPHAPASLSLSRSCTFHQGPLWPRLNKGNNDGTGPLCTASMKSHAQTG
ncbi:hypothetical protein JB92DRAFT_2988224, partial [Gautieria morchelliformis]